MDFTIESPAGSQIEIVQEIPKHLRRFSLPGAKTHYLKAGFGDMLFHHYEGEGFSIWYSNYLIRHKAKVIGRTAIPVLEWHIHIRNCFRSVFDGNRVSDLKVNQLGVSYFPYVHNTVEFIANTQYDTFDIHLYKPLLDEYAKECPALDRFMLKVQKEEASELLTEIQYLDPEMVRLINSILQYDCRDAHAGLYFESVVNQLLIRFIHRLDKLEGTRPRIYTLQDIQLAERAKVLIETELDKAYTTAQLARKLGTNTYKLKTTFKFLFDTTVYAFSKAARMKHAKDLLLESNYTQHNIGLLIGYPDQSNFHIAFKNYFGITPEQFRKDNGKRDFG